MENLLNIVSVCTGTFDQFNASLLNKHTFIFLKKEKKNFWMVVCILYTLNIFIAYVCKK